MILSFALGSIVVVATPAQANPPAFQMPFPCGEKWRASTYSGHDAIDWNAYPDDNNRAVVASAAGNASLEYQPSYGGYMVNIDHGGGWKTVYAHLHQNGRVSGQVTAGQIIGYVGSTGGSTAPHLHWEQKLNGVKQVPLYADGVALNPGSSANQTAPEYTSNNCGGVMNGSLLQVENTGGGWSAYNITQTTGINVKGKPSVLWGAGGPNVFAAGSDGALRQFTICPSGTGWCSYVVLSPGALGGAGVSVAHTGSAIEVFATTQDGTLLQVENTGSGWQAYNISQAAGGVRIKGAPAVLWGSSGGPNVFAVDTNGAMRQFKLCPGGGWCSYVLTATNMFAGGVDATKNGSNIELFARSTGNHLYQVEFASGGWSVYDVTNFSGGVQIKGTPGVLWTSSGPSVYVADTAGRLRQFVICSSGTSWCTYEILQPGALGSGAGVDVVHTGSAIEVFVGSKG